jgi:hypothetical protein
MNIKILLIGLNAVLMAWIYFNLNDQDQPGMIDKLTNISNLDELQQIEIIKQDRNFLLTKEGFVWKIKKPIEWEVDEFSITNFITIFSHLDFNKLFDFKEITDRGEIVSDYGINSESIILQLVKPNHTIKIRIGNSTRDKKFVFCEVQIDENPDIEIWRISNELLDIAEIPLQEWAINNLIRTNLHQVQSISASIKLNNSNLNTTKLIKNDTGEWEFELPFKTKANNENVRLLLNRLLTIKVTDFNVKDEKIVSSMPAFDDWKFKLVLTSNNLNHEFQFSEEIRSDESSYYYCKTNYTDHFIKLDESFKSYLSDWSTKLRERKIFRLKNESIQKIVISNSDIKTKLSRSFDNIWEITSNEDTGFEADPLKVNQFLLYLNRMEIKEFISFEAEQSDIEFNLENKSVYKIQITNKDTEVKTILIQNNQLDATLSKILMVEESVLCLADEDWTKILNIKTYEFKKRRILSKHNSIKNVQISSFDSNQSIYNLENNLTIDFSSDFKNFEVESFVNDKSRFDGTWLKGDWVPWTYLINIEYSDNTNSRIFLSEKLSEKQWLGSLSKENLTFNLPIYLIQKLSKVTKSSY